jgi:hypothetical protein
MIGCEERAIDTKVRDVALTTIMLALLTRELPPAHERYSYHLHTVSLYIESWIYSYQS